MSRIALLASFLAPGRINPSRSQMGGNRSEIAWAASLAGLHPAALSCPLATQPHPQPLTRSIRLCLPVGIARRAGLACAAVRPRRPAASCLSRALGHLPGIWLGGVALALWRMGRFWLTIWVTRARDRLERPANMLTSLPSATSILIEALELDFAGGMAC